MTTHTVELTPGVSQEIERLAREAGITVQQFLAAAATEKLSAVQSARALLAERAQGADWAAFERVFGPGNVGEPPQDWDKID